MESKPNSENAETPPQHGGTESPQAPKPCSSTGEHSECDYRKTVEHARREQAARTPDCQRILPPQNLAPTRGPLRECPTCRETYWESQFEGASCPDCASRAKRAEERRVRMLLDCGISLRHSDLRTFRELMAHGPASYIAAAGRLECWLASERSTVACLTGIRGTGKTQLASVAVRESCEGGKSAKIENAALILSSLSGTFGAPGDHLRNWLNEWGWYWLLVIDEVGAMRQTEWAMTALEQLVDARYQRQRKTILISNQSKSDLEHTLGDSIVSRMTEGGGVIVCDWQSFRAVRR